MDSDLGPALGREQVPSRNRCALSWGTGDARQMVSRNGNLKLCSKLLPVFKQFKATKSSGDKEHWTWSASKPLLSMRPVPFLLLTHLFQTVMWDTHFPLYWFPCVPPGGKVGWWKGVGDAGLAAGTPPRYLQAPLSVCPVLEAAHVCWEAPTSIKGCFCGCLRHLAWLPPSPLCVPLPSKAHPTLLLLQTEAASGFPSATLLHSATALCVSRVVGVSVSFQAPPRSPKPHGLGCCWAVGSLVSRL